LCLRTGLLLLRNAEMKWENRNGLERNVRSKDVHNSLRNHMVICSDLPAGHFKFLTLTGSYKSISKVLLLSCVTLLSVMVVADSLRIDIW
jgi:hypothetical protein